MVLSTGGFKTQGPFECLESLINLVFFEERPSPFFMHGSRALSRQGKFGLKRLIEGVFLEGLLIGQHRLFPVPFFNMLVTPSGIRRHPYAAASQ